MSGVGGRWLEVCARIEEGWSVEDGELAEALVALGGRAVEERDGWMVTHLPEPSVQEACADRIGDRLRELLSVPVVVTLAWREAEDWAETWKRGLGPRRITPRLWVTPSWKPIHPGPGEVVVVVDPGMAFGTAEHGTTRGALRLLDQALASGERLLDVGAGSAILAVAAALLGAGEVVALEGDPVAGEYARENVERNGVSDRVRWVETWADAGVLRAFGPVDGVLANIETGVLRGLLPGLRDVLRPGGWLILSGILDIEWVSFEAELRAAGFRPERLDEDGEWRSVWLTLPSVAPAS